MVFAGKTLKIRVDLEIQGMNTLAQLEPHHIASTLEVQRPY